MPICSSAWALPLTSRVPEVGSITDVINEERALAGAGANEGNFSPRAISSDTPSRAECPCTPGRLPSNPNMSRKR